MTASPLLVLGNGDDHTVPASVSREAADYALDWANRHVGVPEHGRS